MAAFKIAIRVFFFSFFLFLSFFFSFFLLFLAVEQILRFFVNELEFPRISGSPFCRAVARKNGFKSSTSFLTIRPMPSNLISSFLVSERFFKAVMVILVINPLFLSSSSFYSGL